MTIKILEHGSAEYEQMIQLRVRVLLAPINVPESFINKEQEQQDIQIGAFDNDCLIGCCVLTARNSSTVQLRQMAVHSDYQGTGVGKAIVAFAEDTSRTRGFSCLIMHARDAVLPFYERSGYTVAGPQFFEVGIPHHKMQKLL